MGTPVAQSDAIMRKLLTSCVLTIVPLLVAPIAGHAETLRLPAPDATAVPTNTVIWLGDRAVFDNLRAYDLRDARGVRIPVEHSAQRVNTTGLHRIRPIAPLAPSTSYTISLTFSIGPAESYTFTTGAGLATSPPAAKPLRFTTSSEKVPSWPGCPDVSVFTHTASAEPSEGAAFYLLERSSSPTDPFVPVDFSATPMFSVRGTYNVTGTYRLRPMALTGGSPADGALQTGYAPYVLPETVLEPCDADHEVDAGCSASGGASGATLVLLLTCALGLRRRAGRPLARRRSPGTRAALRPAWRFLLGAALLLGAPTAARAEQLRVPAANATDVPTNAVIWVANRDVFDGLRSYGLRDSQGTLVPTEHTVEQISSTGLHRIRPISPLAATSTYTLSLEFITASAETYSFTTGAGMATGEPPVKPLVFGASVEKARAMPGCPTVNVLSISASAEPSEGAVFYLLERARSPADPFIPLDFSTTPMFAARATYNVAGTYRLRPVAITGASPADDTLGTGDAPYAELETDPFPCQQVETSVGCSATGGGASSATLALLVTCAAGLRRRARRRAGR